MKKRFIPLIAVIVSIAFSAWASIARIGWVGQKEISDKYFSLITPAPFTFSIWTLIYLAFIVVAFMIATKKIKVNFYQKMLFSGVLLLSSAWLIPWQLDMIGISVWVIFILFLLTLELFIKSRNEEKLFCLTTELFTGWILVATTANFVVFLISTGNIINLPQALIFLSFIFVVDSIFLIKYKALIPAFVFIWTSIGIYAEQNDIILKKWLATLSFIMILLLLKEIFKPKIWGKKK